MKDFLLVCVLLWTLCLVNSEGPPPPQWPDQFTCQYVTTFESPDKTHTAARTNERVYYDYSSPNARERMESELGGGDRQTIIRNYAEGKEYTITSKTLSSSTCTVGSVSKELAFPPNWLASAEFKGAKHVRGMCNEWHVEAKGATYYEGVINRTPIRIQGKGYQVDFLDYRVGPVNDYLFNPCTGHPTMVCTGLNGLDDESCVRPDMLSAPGPAGNPSAENPPAN